MTPAQVRGWVRYRHRRVVPFRAENTLTEPIVGIWDRTFISRADIDLSPSESIMSNISRAFFLRRLSSCSTFLFCRGQQGYDRRNPRRANPRRNDPVGKTEGTQNWKREESILLSSSCIHCYMKPRKYSFEKPYRASCVYYTRISIQWDMHFLATGVSVAWLMCTRLNIPTQEAGGVVCFKNLSSPLLGFCYSGCAEAFRRLLPFVRQYLPVGVVAERCEAFLPVSQVLYDLVEFLFTAGIVLSPT